MQTPYLTRLVIEGYNEKAEADFKVDRWVAWHIAALGRVDAKKFPKLQAFVNPVGKKSSGNVGEDFKAYLMAHNQRLKNDH